MLLTRFKINFKNTNPESLRIAYLSNQTISDEIVIILKKENKKIINFVLIEPKIRVKLYQKFRNRLFDPVSNVNLYSQVSIKQANSHNYFEGIFHPARSY